MTQHKYFEKMESLEFQVQFSVLSGFQSLLRAYSHDPTVKNMLAEMDEDPGQTQQINDRITYLLRVADPRYFDESIAAYLFCIWKTDPPIAHKASERVLATGGLWWSVRLALHIIKEAQVETA